MGPASTTRGVKTRNQKKASVRKAMAKPVTDFSAVNVPMENEDYME